MTIAELLDVLRWVDRKPLRDHLETQPYCRRILTGALDTFDDDGRARFNLIVDSAGKKNWKTSRLVLAGLYCLLNPSPGGNQCYILANDEGQAADDLSLAKKIIAVNPALSKLLIVQKKIIHRRDGCGFLEILPAQDVVGTHGKTYRFCGYDEIHGYKNWDQLEATQPDPTRLDAVQWYTSYASLYHRPGAPLHDLFQAGKAGNDPRMFFSWFAADFCTDPSLANADPEARANPSRDSWADQGYLDQQRRRLPAHKFRRLHLNLPGLPEGSAFTAEMIMSAFDRTRADRPPEPGIDYRAFVDMSGGSSDDAVLAIGYQDPDGRAIGARIVNQGQPPPFDPIKAVMRFVPVLRAYGVSSVTGDAYAGETFKSAFEDRGISYHVSDLSTSKLYEALEPHLNGGRVLLPNVPEVEQQLLGLVWKGGKIDHPGGEHDDFANAVAGLVYLVIDPEAAGTRELEQAKATLETAQSAYAAARLEFKHHPGNSDAKHAFEVAEAALADAQKKYRELGCSHVERLGVFL